MITEPLDDDAGNFSVRGISSSTARGPRGGRFHSRCERAPPNSIYCGTNVFAGFRSRERLGSDLIP